jgi:ribose transport system ATP-binding protein
MSQSRVELLNIHKSFGGIVALHDVSLSAQQGEIHAIVGENGAGKSTLMKILSGAYRMDSGEIRLSGEKVTISEPRDGRELGIGIIYQEFSLIPDLSVAENIYLHFLKQSKNWMPWSEIHAMAGELIRSLGFEIPVRMKVRQLSTSVQQVVEIAKALSEKLDVLILDEPTAVLAPHETRKLFEVLNRLRKQGVTILYISHRLEEVFEIADNITILKDGRVTRSVRTSDITREEVISLMIGRKLDMLFPERESLPGEVRLEVNGLAAGGRIRDISFSVRKGEVMGLAGLVGSGRTETVRAIFAADSKERGKVWLDREELNLRSPRDAVRAGIGLVPEDRKTEGVLLGLTVRENLTLTGLKAISRKSGFIRESKERAKAEVLILEMNIRTGTTETKVHELSGGNQQKVVLGKWLGSNCKVLILDEPTRGIDVGAKAEIYKLINDLSSKGICIIMVSSEMTELMGMCDRILVMHEGTVNGELERSRFSEEQIMKLSISKNELI